MKCSGALLFENQSCWWNLVGSRVSNTCLGPESVLYCSVLGTGDRLARAEESVATAHSAISWCSPDFFAVNRIETVAVHVTIDAERDGDS